MKRENYIFKIVASIVVLGILVGTVTALAINFGKNASEHASAKSTEAADITTVNTESFQETEDNTDYSYYDVFGNSDYEGEIPTSLKKFAVENGLTLDQWPDELIKLLSNNPESEEFVLNYPYKKGTEQSIDLSEYAYCDSVPLFLQWDQRWGYISYGDDIIATAGCGPTCLSMVCVYLLGDTSLSPKAVAQFSEEYGYCVAGNGSEWTLISEGGEMLGLDVWELPLDEGTVIQNLQAGNPVICIMGPGDFTDGGHYIVMTDYVDGQIKINDPNSITRSEKLWNFEDIESQINNLWACSAY